MSAGDVLFEFVQMGQQMRVAAIDDRLGELSEYMDQCVAGQVFKIVRSMPTTASGGLQASQYRQSILADTLLTV